MRLIFWILAILAWLNLGFTLVTANAMFGAVAISIAFSSAITLTGIAGILSAIHGISEQFSKLEKTLNPVPAKESVGILGGIANLLGLNKQNPNN